MKNDVVTKVILSGILISLIVISINLDSIDVSQEAPYVEVQHENSGEEIVQISPNVIGIIDNGFRTGWKQLIVFEYNPETKDFEKVSTLPYEDILNHPELHNIPIQEDKYGDKK